MLKKDADSDCDLVKVSDELLISYQGLNQFSTDLIQTKLSLQDKVESLNHLKVANEALKGENEALKHQMIALNQLKAAEDQVKEQAGTHVYHYEKVVHVAKVQSQNLLKAVIALTALIYTKVKKIVRINRTIFFLGLN